MFALAGCGRIGFDATTGSSDARRDSTGMFVDSGPSLCSQTPVALCDGFEQPSLDSRWMIDLFAGTATIDMTRSYRGNGSLHVHTNAVNPGTGPQALVRTSQGIGGAVTGMVYARAWAYFASPYPTIVFNQVLNFATTSGIGISMGSQDGMAKSNDYAFFQSATSATVAVPVDQWTCLQLEEPSNIEGTTRVFIDGVEAIDIRLTTPFGTPQPAPDHIYVGVDWQTSTMAMPPTDAWIDELIVDTQPTTCAQ